MVGLCRVKSAAVIGIEAIPVTIEISVTNGIGVYLVGLPDSAVKESLMRITAAFMATGFRMPGRRIIINMAPANLRKEGSCYDAAIAIGILAASDQIDIEVSEDCLIVGELSLDGRLRRVTGTLPVVLSAISMNFKFCIVPSDSSSELAGIDEIVIFGADSLRDIIEILKDPDSASRFLINTDIVTGKATKSSDRLSLVKGQEFAKRGLEIAASGGHNLILTGTPGSGKSMLAGCVPSVLPPMTKQEALETNAIYSVSGLLRQESGFLRERPFRSPHHKITSVAMVGGGADVRPGEISLAHNGVLFLDEIAEFSPHILNQLRQPMEERTINLSRSKYKVKYPASFMLVASMNPCPCGYYGYNDLKCRCSGYEISRYLSRLSGPLMDRIDLQIRVKELKGEEIISPVKGLSAGEIAERVVMARGIQLKRFSEDGCFTNSHMSDEMLLKYCVLGKTENEYLKHIIDRFSISARGYTRILKISRTIADLSGKEFITLEDISEAVMFRVSETGLK